MKQPPDRGKEKVKAPLTTKTEQCNGQTGEAAGVKPLSLSLSQRLKVDAATVSRALWVVPMHRACEMSVDQCVDTPGI